MTLLAKVVMVALLCYFAVVIYRANIKLTSGDIGIVSTTKNQKIVKESYS